MDTKQLSLTSAVGGTGQKYYNDSEEIEEESSSITDPRSTTPKETAEEGLLDTRNSRSYSQSHVRQKFIIIIVDPNINELEDAYRDWIVQLQRMVSSVQLFSGPDQCLEFTMNIGEERLLFILSDYQNETFVSLISQIVQTDSIYMVMNEVAKQEPWMSEQRKIRFVCSSISAIVDRVRQYLQHCDQDAISTSILSGHSDDDLDQLEQSFMYSVLLKEILLEMDYDEKAKKSFFQLCRDKYAARPIQLNEIDKMESSYDQHSPIRWFIKKPFIYSTLNTALRAQDIASIIQMGFYLKDLHQQIEHVYCENKPMSPLTVYRGQNMSCADFDHMKRSIGGLLSFNGFLSTTTDRQIASIFANVTDEDPQKTGLLFEIQIDPNDAKIPYASLAWIPDCSDVEDEILFSMHTVFRICSIECTGDRLWHVLLVSTSDTDTQLQLLTNHFRAETQEPNQLHRLGSLLIQMGQFDEARRTYDGLMTTIPENDLEERARVYNKLGNICLEKGDFDLALSYFRKTLDIQLVSLPPNHPHVATTYNNIGLLHNRMGQYSRALAFYEQARTLSELTLPRNHPKLATTHDNIGLVYYNMGEYSKALEYYEKANDILQKSLPANHPDVATLYNNIGLVYENMGEYSKALSFYEKTLEIRQKSLPASHPSLASIYNNIGSLHQAMGDYSTARLQLVETLEIQLKVLPADHPDLATTYYNLGWTSHSMGEYAQALFYLEKTLEIRQRSLPGKHPDLAATYNTLGLIYLSMSNYSRAINSFDKALAIFQETLPYYHPSLIDACNNIGATYQAQGEYAKALSFYQKTNVIRQRTMPANHPSVAATYINIGSVYSSMGEHSRALPFFKKALRAQIITLTKSHPSLATTYNYIGRAHAAQQHYVDASSYYQDALKIQEKVLTPNHPSLAETYNDIGDMQQAVGDCSAALSYYAKALSIQEKVLAPNHPTLATTCCNLGQVYFRIKKYETALSSLERAIDIQNESLPPNHPSLAFSHYTIAQIFGEREQYEKAMKHASEAVRIITENVESDPSQVRNYLEYFESLRLNTGIETNDRQEKKSNE